MAILFSMPRTSPPAYPRHRQQLAALGDRLRAARLRRRLTQAMVAERVGIAIPTLRKLEAGDPAVSLATLIRVLHVLGLGQDIDVLAAHDTLGRALQDQALNAPRPARARVAPERPR